MDRYPPPQQGAHRARRVVASSGAAARANARRTARFRRRRIGAALVSLLVVIALIVGGAFAYAHYRYSQITKVGLPSARGTLASGKPFNVLLVGSDSRSGLTSSQQASYGSASQVGGKRADTMVLVRINPKTGKAAMLSIPYNYFAPIANTSHSDRISNALNGGPNELVATIQQDLHIPISHYLEVNFGGLINIVNAMGGVKVDFPYPSKDTMSGLNIPNTGCQLLNGKQSLALVRSRYFSYFKNGSWHFDGTADFGRIHRQHAFLQAAVRRVRSTIVTNPVALNNLLGAAAKNLTVDNKLSLTKFAQLALQLRSVASGHITGFTLPTQIVNNYGQYGDVLFPVPGQDAAVISQFMNSVGPSGTKPAAGASAASPISDPVQVLNGDGTSGIAAVVSKALGQAGIKVSGVGNASTFTHRRSVILYAPKAHAQALALGAKLNSPVLLQQAPTGSSPLVLVVGSTYNGIKGASTASSAGSSSSAASGNASSIATPNATPSNPGSIVGNSKAPSFDPYAC